MTLPPLGPRAPLRNQARCLTDDVLTMVLATNKWVGGQPITAWLETTVQEEIARRSKILTFGTYIDF